MSFAGPVHSVDIVEGAILAHDHVLDQRSKYLASSAPTLANLQAR